MIRKIVCTCIAAFLLLAAPGPALAAEYDGCLRISLNVGDLAVTNGAFTLHRVGIRTSDGYRIAEEFGGGFVRQEDALSPHLAQWMAEIDTEQGRTLLLDADGNAVFSQLGEGLYLVVQSEKTDGFYPIQPFLMSIPRDGRWDVIVNTEPLPIIMASPTTGDEDLLLLGMLGMTGSAIGIVMCTAARKRKM